MRKQKLLMALTVPVLAGLFSVVNARDMLARYMDDIKAGPSTYYTPEAARYYGQSSQGREAFEKSFQAMRSLSDMGMASSPAIALIIEKFPAAVHVATVSGKRFTGGEPFDDWVSTFIIGGKSSIMLSPPFLDDRAMMLCESSIDVSHTLNFIEKNEGAGGAIRSALVDIHIIYRVNLAACMLSGITGINAGSTPDGWRNWLMANEHMVPGYANAPAQLAPHVHGHPNFKDFVVGGRYRLLMVTKQDLNGTVISVSDTAIVFETADENRRFRLLREQIFRSRLVELPEEKQAPSNATPAKQPEQPPQTASSPTPSAQSAAGKAFVFEDLNLLREGTNIEVTLNNGSLLVGKLHSFDGKILTLELVGLRIPLRGTVVESVVVPR